MCRDDALGRGRQEQIRENRHKVRASPQPWCATARAWLLPGTPVRRHDPPTRCGMWSLGWATRPSAWGIRTVGTSPLAGSSGALCARSGACARRPAHHRTAPSRNVRANAGRAKHTMSSTAPATKQFSPVHAMPCEAPQSPHQLGQLRSRPPCQRVASRTVGVRMLQARTRRHHGRLGGFEPSADPSGSIMLYCKDGLRVVPGDPSYYATIAHSSPRRPWPPCQPARHTPRPTSLPRHPSRDAAFSSPSPASSACLRTS